MQFIEGRTCFKMISSFHVPGRGVETHAREEAASLVAQTGNLVAGELRFEKIKKPSKSF